MSLNGKVGKTPEGGAGRSRRQLKKLGRDLVGLKLELIRWGPRSEVGKIDFLRIES